MSWQTGSYRVMVWSCEVNSDETSVIFSPFASEKSPHLLTLLDPMLSPCFSPALYQQVVHTNLRSESLSYGHHTRATPSSS